MVRNLCTAALLVLALACSGDAESTTTPAPAATEASAVSADPTVIFDGTTCTYEGPMEFEAGTLPKIAMRNRGDIDFEFVLLQIDPGLDYATVAAMMEGLTVYGFDMPEGIHERSAGGMMRVGDERTTNMALATAGTYLPACLERPDPLWRISAAFVTATDSG